jgi:biopolymer transport protein ExbD
MTRILAIAVITLAASAGAAIAADLPAPDATPQPQCRQALVDVKRDTADAAISPNKQIQIQSLLDQVDRACQQNDDVVAMAGIDQIRAIVSDEQKSRNGS